MGWGNEPLKKTLKKWYFNFEGLFLSQKWSYIKKLNGIGFSNAKSSTSAILNNFRNFVWTLRPSNSLPPTSPPFWGLMVKLDFLIFAVSISQDHISHLLDWHFLVRLLHTPFHFHGFTHFQFIFKENLMIFTHLAKEQVTSKSSSFFLSEYLVWILFTIQVSIMMNCIIIYTMNLTIKFDIAPFPHVLVKSIFIILVGAQTFRIY